jgi:hypothetical protein
MHIKQTVFLLLGIYPKEYKSVYNKGTCTPVFIAALFTIAMLWKQPRCPTTDGWIKKSWHLHTMEFYPDIKKTEILSFASKQNWRTSFSVKSARFRKSKAPCFLLYVQI